MMSGCIGRSKPPKRREPAERGNEVACAHCQCRMIGAGGRPWTFTCGACGKPVCDDCEQSGGCPGEASRTVTCAITCSPCCGCGDPYYVDGCLKCGYGISGNLGNERCD